MISIGIDPGVTGAMCALGADGSAQFHDAPTVSLKVGKKVKNVLDPMAMALMLESYASASDVMVTIEKVQAMPGSGERSMGATSAFSFGQGYGFWIGICAALRIPYQLVAPVTWKKRMMPDSSKEKDASRVRAMQMFPKAAEKLNLKKHHGRSDALLLAAYALENMGIQAKDDKADAMKALNDVLKLMRQYGTTLEYREGQNSPWLEDGMRAGQRPYNTLIHMDYSNKGVGRGSEGLRILSEHSQAHHFSTLRDSSQDRKIELEWVSSWNEVGHMMKV